jgi:hypothetical protein
MMEKGQGKVENVFVAGLQLRGHRWVQFATEYCCFVRNKVKPLKNQNVLKLRETSMDVLLGSDVMHQSYADRFFNLEKISIFRADARSRQQ